MRFKATRKWTVYILSFPLSRFNWDYPCKFFIFPKDCFDLAIAMSYCIILQLYRKILDIRWLSDWAGLLDQDWGERIKVHGTCRNVYSVPVTCDTASCSNLLAVHFFFLNTVCGTSLTIHLTLGTFSLVILFQSNHYVREL